MIMTLSINYTSIKLYKQQRRRQWTDKKKGCHGLIFLPRRKLAASGHLACPREDGSRRKLGKAMDTSMGITERACYSQMRRLILFVLAFGCWWNLALPCCIEFLKHWFQWNQPIYFPPETCVSKEVKVISVFGCFSFQEIKTTTTKKKHVYPRLNLIKDFLDFHD